MAIKVIRIVAGAYIKNTETSWETDGPLEIFIPNNEIIKTVMELLNTFQKNRKGI